MADALRAIEVSKTYDKGRPNEVRALRDATLAVEEGECVVLQGPSGSGKTTLLSVLACMTRPTRGRVRVHGEDVSTLSDAFLSRKRRDEVGVLFQHFNLVPDLTALRNVALPTVPTGTPRGERRRRARDLLDTFGVADKAGTEARLLSGGEKQRVALARALVNDPGIVVADEPTAHLDTDTADSILAELRRLKRDGLTLVVATHDPAVAERGFVDRTLRVVDGRLEP